MKSLFYLPFFFIFFCWVLSPSLLMAQNWKHTQKIISPDRGDVRAGRIGISVGISGDYAVLGRESQLVDLNTGVGGVYLFKKDSLGKWQYFQSLETSTWGTGADSYKIVAISKDYVFFYRAGGAPSVLYIYIRNNRTNNWTYMGAVFAFDITDLVIDNDYAIMGNGKKSSILDTINRPSYSGTMTVLKKDTAGYWKIFQEVEASKPTANAYFGNRVAMDGDYIIAGAQNDSNDERDLNPKTGAGSAYIFKRDTSGRYRQIQKIVASDRTIGHQFGQSVAIKGDFAFVGRVSDASNADNNVYIFKKDALGVWREAQKVNSPTLSIKFGLNIKMNENYALISTLAENAHKDQVYIYKKDSANNWIFANDVTPPDNINYTTNFGQPMALGNNDAIIGAPFGREDEIGRNPTYNGAGSAYILQLSLIKTSVIKTVCGGHIVINAPSNLGTPPFQYAINAGIYQDSNAFYNLLPAVYTIKVKDALGQVFSTIETVYSNTAPLILPTPVLSNAVCGLNNGTILIPTPTTSRPPYQFSLNNSAWQDSNTFKGLGIGTYTIKAKDALGCESNPSTVLIKSAPLELNFNISNAFCGLNNGIIKVNTPIFGSPPYQYSLNNGAWQTTNVFNNIGVGTYTIVGKDSASCVSLPYNIEIINETKLNTTVVQPSCSARTGIITVQIPNLGTPPYQYALNNDSFQINNVFRNLLPGIYRVTVKDFNNCQFNQTVILSDRNVTPTPSIAVMSTRLMSSSITGNQWYRNGVLIAGATGQFYIVTETGEYSLTVTINGCISDFASVKIATVGINDALENLAFSIYPNPTKDAITINATGIKLPLKMTVTNNLGQIIETQTLNKHISTVQFSTVPNGIYYIELSNNEGHSVQKLSVYR